MRDSSQPPRTERPSVFEKCRSALSTRNRYTEATKLVLALGLLAVSGMVLVRGDKLPWMVDGGVSNDPVLDVVQAIETGDGDRLLKAARQVRQSQQNMSRLLPHMIAAELKRLDAPDQSVRQIVTAVEQLFPADAVDTVSRARDHAIIADGLWQLGDIEAAARQSQAVVDQVGERWPDEQSVTLKQVVIRLTQGMHDVPALRQDPGQAEARRLLKQLAAHCAADQSAVDESHFDAAEALIQTMVAAGDRDTATSYYKRWADHAAQTLPATGLRAFAESVATGSDDSLETADQVDALRGVLMVSLEAAPDAELGEVWGRYAKAADETTRARTYRDLLQANTEVSIRAAGQMLPAPSASQSLGQIRENHFQLIATDMTRLARSPALDHLVAMLEQRNADEQIEDLTRFFWQRFPGQWVGAQAFTIWAGRRTPGAGLGEAAAISRRIRRHAPEAPIARVARLTLARTAAAEGRTLQALVEVAELSDGEPLDPQARLSFDVARELVETYQRELARYRVAVDPVPLYLGLGEQLHAAGEPVLAAALYWQVREALDRPYVDPRSSEPMPAPNLTRAGRGEREATVRFWRAAALGAVGRQAEAIEELEVVAADYPHTAVAGLAQFALVQQLTETGHREQAQQQLAMLPATLADSDAGRALREQLAQESQP